MFNVEFTTLTSFFVALVTFDELSILKAIVQCNWVSLV